MKKPIEWHKQCLNNLKKYLDLKQREFKRLQDEIARTQEHVRLRESQIESAIKQGRTSYDPDKYLVSKHNKKLK